MVIKYNEGQCVIVDVKSLNERDFSIVSELPVGFCILIPKARTELLDMLSEIRKAGFSEEFIDFVYVKYFYGYKVIAISIDGYLPEKRMLLDVKMPVKVLYIPKFPDVVVIGEDVMI